MSITAVQLLTDLQGPWGALQIRLIGPDNVPAETITLPDLYPFMSVADLKRLIWIERGSDPRYAPERVFVGVRSSDGASLRPLEFWWPGGPATALLPDPLIPANQIPSSILIDEAGNRKPVSPVVTAGLLLENILEPTDTVEAICIASISIPSTSPALFGGFWQLYWPWLTLPTQIADAASTSLTAADRTILAATVPYIEDRIGRISIVQRALRAGLAGQRATLTSLVRMRWILPLAAERPKSLEKTFYGLPASEKIPFLRYYPAGGGAPLLKLGLNPDGSAIINDPRILAAYLNRPAPIAKSAVVVARIPVISSHVERGAAFVLHLFEDGSTDITLEVPQQGATYIAAVATDAERQLRGVLAAIGYPPETVPLLRDLHATYRWTHPDPSHTAPLSATKIAARAAALTPFFDTVPAVPGETAMAVLRWRAVSNYESEAAQFAFITQMVLRRGDVQEGAAARAIYIRELGDKFGLTPDSADATLERWLEQRAEADAPSPSAGAHAVARHATGASVAISGIHPEYVLELQDVDSPSELQRLLSVVAVLLAAPASELSLTAPAPAVAAAAAAVAVAEVAAEEAIGTAAEADIGEMDPAMAALMADLGYDLTVGGPELVINADTAASPPPVAAADTVSLPPPIDIDAALATIGDAPCAGTQWAPGEPALTIKPDWYMDRLKHEDKILFGYASTATGRVKGFSKTCQRRDGRQPNVLTQNQYIRVRHCYEGRVRFIQLPPTKPSDLPQDPAWKPTSKLARDDEYYMRDPESGLPMWTVYGYINKTDPTKRTYLMCPELWCDRDGLPLLRDEFAGTEGRGFTKPPMTCPFCGGRPIAALDAPEPGESVIVRTPKESTGKYHSFIGTVTRTKHPDGYALPCCDTTPRLLKKYMKLAYENRLTYGQELFDDDDETGLGASAAPEDTVIPELEEPMIPEASGVTADEPTVGYAAKLSSMQTQYILGSDKALEAGKIGLLSPLLDTFFGQKGPAAIRIQGIRPTFIEDASVFVRVGVDVQLQAPGRNLFAGLAPLLGKESAEQVQRLIMESTYLVRAFESANYGTLLHEFAARSTLTDAEVDGSLIGFAGTNAYSLTDASRPHITRLYRAYMAFLNCLRSVRQPKHLRHLEHILAHPGVVAPRGLLLIVLEQHGDRIEVVCPTFGLPSSSIYSEVPVAFLWHDRRDDTWEPIVLYNGTKQAVLLFTERSADIPIRYREAIGHWIREWRASCGRPRPPPHVWTPGRDTAGLPRLSQFVRNPNTQSLVRDRSNRLAGILLKTPSLVFVPCLDDGTLAVKIPRVYEATMIPATPLASYLQAYKELSTSYGALRPTQLLIRITDSGVSQIVGLELAVGTMIPVAPEVYVADSAPLPVQQIDAFSWERDALILRAADAPPTQIATMEESTASVEEQLAEAYQHIRLSLSHMLPRQPVLAANIRRIIARLLPLYERRKRMDIALEPVIRTMIFAEESTERRTLPLLRVDCLSLTDKSDCGEAGACSWSGGRCLIHTPIRPGAGGAASVVRIMTARLSDELLRYASRRRELFDDAVPEIRTPRGAVRIGDELFFATRQNESADSVIDRLGLGGEITMTFPEELLRFEGADADDVTLVVDAVSTKPEARSAVASSVFPPEWISEGFMVATPLPGLENPALFAFAEASGRPIMDWTTQIKRIRRTLHLVGPEDGPLQWSIQDQYSLASVLLANILIVDGTGRIGRWIAPSSKFIKEQRPNFVVLWGPQQLTLFRLVPKKQYIFKRAELPKEIQEELLTAAPIPEAEAQGTVDAIVPSLVETSAVLETKTDS